MTFLDLALKHGVIIGIVNPSSSTANMMEVHFSKNGCNFLQLVDHCMIKQCEDNLSILENRLCNNALCELIKKNNETILNIENQFEQASNGKG